MATNNNHQGTRTLWLSAILQRSAGLVFLSIWTLTTMLMVVTARAQYDSSAGGAAGFDGFVNTGGGYSPMSGDATRKVRDLHVNGVVGSIPLDFVRIYHSRSAKSATSMGTWRTNWDYGLTESGYTFSISLPGGASYQIYLQDQSSWKQVVGSDGIQAMSNGNTFSLLLQDGTTVVFSGTGTGGNYTWQLHQIVDPYGQVYQVTITNVGGTPAETDTVITEPAGRWIKLRSWYQTSGSGGIQEVDASDGQYVKYSYAMIINHSVDVLQQVTYQDGTTTATCSYQGDGNGGALLYQSNEPRFGGPMKNIYYVFVPYSTYHVTGILSAEWSYYTAVSSRSISSQSTSSAPIVIETRPDGSTRTFYGNATGLVTGVTDFAGANTYYSYSGKNQIISSTDANGYTTNFTRESIIGAVTQIKHPDNTTVQMTYTNSILPFYLASVTDERGYKTLYTRDSNNRVTRIDYPNGAFETCVYNSFGEVTSHQLANGGITTYTYDSAGRKTSQTDPSGKKVDFTYDSRDRLATLYEEARGLTTQFSYNQWDQLLQVKNPDSTTTTYTYDADGNKLTATNELGNTCQWTYDQYSRVESATDPLKRTTKYVYNNGGQASWNFTNGAPSSVTSPGGLDTSYTYDGDWRMLTKTVGTGNLAATTTYTYDNNGNTLTVTDPLQNTGSSLYDKRNRVTKATDALGHATNFTYDDSGHVLTVKRANGALTTNVYDSMGHITSTTDPLGAVNTYGYDSSGNVTSFVDGNQNSYSWQYDLLNRKTVATYPDGSSEKWSYDVAGNLSQFTNSAGIVKQYAFDSRNRLASWTWKSPDQFGDTVNYTYDSAGNATKIVNNYSSLSNVYDAANQLALVTQAPVNGPSHQLAYAYNADGQRTSLTIAGLYAIQYTYTKRDQVSAIEDGSGNAIASYTYDLAGNRIERSLENGASTTYAYDQGNRLNTQTDYRGSTPFLTSQYTYDNVNRNTAITHQGGTDNRSFSYDLKDQLTSLQFGGPTPTSTLIQLAYDRAGNRTSTQQDGNPSSSYTVNKLNQYTAVGTATPQYDQQHNLTGYNGATFTFDWSRRLYSGLNGPSDVESRYDGLGRCVSRTINGITTFITFDGWNPIFETDALGNQTSARIYGTGTDELIAGFGSTGSNAFYYHQDRAKNVTALTDINDNLVEQYSYNPFGQAFIFDGSRNPISASAYGNRFMFQGREFIAALGIYDFRNRAYSPDLGRFLQMDPSGFGGGNNLYRFASNNPVNAMDPSGLTVWGTDTFGFDLGITVTGYTDFGGQQQYIDTQAGFTTLSPGALQLFLQQGSNLGSPNVQQRWQPPAPISVVHIPSPTPPPPAPTSTSPPPPAAPQKSSDILLALVPGQAAWDGAVNSYLNGDYLNSGLYATTMIAQQVLFAATFGLSSAATQSVQTAFTSIESATSVFWSGGSEAEAVATEWATANNGVTLGMTQAGRDVAAATQGLDWAEAQPLWNAASKEFAAGASGEVQAFIGPNASFNSMFFKTEFPTLLSNPSVTGIGITF